MPRFLFSLFLSLVLSLPVVAQETADTIQHEVLIQTDKGNIRVRLFNDTPKHRDNFLKLVREGFYDGLLFHRVIPNFMVQAGDSASRHAKPGVELGDSPEPYSLPAEIVYPTHFHRQGALAAAREGDDVNPERRSSYSQFYIVTGQVFDDAQLARVQAQMSNEGGPKLSREAREAYRTWGGAPHLDGSYTIFGELIEGFDVTDAIQWVDRDANDRPLEDVHIVKATVVK